APTVTHPLSLHDALPIFALAREGQGDGWVAGSVGPYGALLADGSEYTGDYVDRMTVADLRAFHRPRMEILAEAGADVLACETVRSEEHTSELQSQSNLVC